MSKYEIKDEYDLENRREIRLTGFIVHDDALTNGVAKNNLDPEAATGTRNPEDRLGSPEDRREYKTANGNGKI